MDRTLLELREEILARFTPAETAAYSEFVHWIRSSGITSQALKVGDPAPDFILPDSEGRLVTSQSLREAGPLVVSFFRGDWCPFCTAELCALQAALPEMEALKATLVAITPDTGDYPRKMKRSFGLNRLQVLADVDYGVGLAFGVIFSLPPKIRAFYAKAGIDLPTRHGSSAWMLPIPATYVIDTAGIICDAYVDADFSRRQDPRAIIDRLQTLARAAR